MDYNNAIDITTNHYKKLGKHINRIFRGTDPGAIHEFRVEYKKLRAFLRMISEQPGIENEITVSKELKKFYTISGSIRDLQLQQKRIEDATVSEPKKPQAYLHLLQKEIEKIKPELAEIISGKPVNKSKKKTDASIPAEFPFHFQQYVEKKWSAINAILLSGDFSDENIHAIRKILKDLFYNLKIADDPGKQNPANNIWNGKNDEWMNKFLEELGSFQDKCTSIALLKSYWIIGLNKYNQELLTGLKKSWIREKLSLKQLLIKKMKIELLQKKSTATNLAFDKNH